MIIKRSVDIIISLVLLVLLLPLFVVVGLLVKITSKGPVFYPWKVVGLNNRDIQSYKFRTMVEGADKMKAQLADLNEMERPCFKIKNDPRITGVGSFLRKYSIDELPQLYSVLKGELSLVGPRPPSRAEFNQFEPWQHRKLSVKPGITCLWQVNGRNKITDFTDWVRMDLEYIDNRSTMLDLKILFLTIITVFKGTGE